MNMKKVKTCVYAIALNEEKHVEPFMEASKDADLILICDTGSTDGTVEKLRKLGAVVYSIVQKPWRFDIPRNTALSLIPPDIDMCLSIDLDEYLQPGWMEALDANWQHHNGKIDRVGYDYIWNWTPEGHPGIRFFADKIHHRHNYEWRHPCHETLYKVGKESEIKVTIPEIILHHRADSTKSRGQYLHLLELAVKEAPNNDRMRHYYARELMFKGQYEQAITEFKAHLSLPTAGWKEERASSYRYMSRCYRFLENFEESKNMAILGTIEWPHSREPWMELMRTAYFMQDWSTCFWAATKTLNITERLQSYMSESSSWGSEPYDFAAISAFHLGMKDKAVYYGELAVQLDPVDERLKNNLIWYKS